VQGESPHEFVAFDGHHTGASLVGDVGGGDLDHSGVRYGYPTDIAGEVLRCPLCWSAIWSLDVYDPAISVCLANHRLEGDLGMGWISANE
jgi:hypothetical protein